LTWEDKLLAQDLRHQNRQILSDIRGTANFVIRT